MIKVKICGIKDLETALSSINSGADFLGFNFVRTSKRYITPKDALSIINAIRGKVNVVGVFQNSPLEEVNKITQQLK